MSVSGNGVQGLKELIGRMRNVAGAGLVHPMSVSIGAESLVRIKGCFERSQSPYGDRWPPVSRGGKPLEDTHRLHNAFLNDSGHGTVRISNPTKYANLMNYGGVVEAKNAPYLKFQVKNQGAALAVRGGEVVKRRRGTSSWVQVKRVVILARQFIPDSRGLPAEWLERFRYVAGRAFAQFMRGQQVGAP